jgi:hypothetical protein
MRKVLLFMFVSAFLIEANAQFTSVSSGISKNDHYAYDGYWGLGDFDNDGDLDLGSATQYSTGTRIYKNTSGTFSIQQTLSTTNSNNQHPGGFWCDLNNDGYLDFAHISYGDAQCPIYKNNGNGTFTLAKSFTWFKNGNMDFADFDRDGDYDLVMLGSCWGASCSNNGVKFFRNDGNFAFTEVYSGQVETIQAGQVKFADFNKDGWPDIVAVGTTSGSRTAGTGRAKIWLNKADGTGFQASYAGAGVYDGRVAVGDYNNDGWIDFAVIGEADASWAGSGWVYKNNADGTFTSYTIAGGAGGSIDFGDSDNDGDLDILISSYPTYSRILRNDGSNTFTTIDVLSHPISSTEGGTAAFGDYNNDGKLDIFVQGNWGGSSELGLYRNDVATANSAPAAPGAWGVTKNGQDATINWSAATDGLTPAAGLSYEIMVGTTFGGYDVVAPNSNPTTGYRKIPKMGNAGSYTSYVLKNLPGGIYYVKIQTIDGGYMGSSWFNAGNFTIEAAPKAPVTTAATLVDKYSFRANWDAVTFNNGYYLDVATDAGFTSKVIDGQDCGLSTFVDVSSLTPGYTYYYRVRAYNTYGTSANSNTTSVTLLKNDQTIDFTSLADKTYLSAPFTLSATSTSGLAVSFSSSNTSVATISGNTVTIVGAGTTTITASQAGNISYNAATSVDQLLTVNKASQTITFGAIADKATGSAPFAISATSTSGLPVSFTSSLTSVATVSGNTITVVGAGNTTITAIQSGNDNYLPATSVDQNFHVFTPNQSITFNALDTKTYGDAPFALTASATSGLEVSFTSSDVSVATISGNILTITGGGTCTIYADQAGDGITWTAAPTVSQTFTVNQTSQTITFPTIPNQTVGVPDFDPGATASSGLSVIYTSSNGAVATIVNNKVHIVAVGTVTIYANQAGDLNYLSASQQEQTFSVISYCAASGGSSADETITNVKFGTINNSTSHTSYGNYIHLSTDVCKSSSYNFTATYGANYGGDKVSVWIDWNRDGDFDDAGETVIADNTARPTVSASITVPADASTGSTRLRMRMSYNCANSPCGANCNSYGEVEDYSVNILPTTSISSEPISLVKNGGENASFSVTATGENLTYQWYKDMVLMSGETSSTLSLTNVGASDIADYYCAVTGTCGNVNSATVSLNVNLPYPVATSASSILENGFTANWNEFDGGADYYLLDVATDIDFNLIVSGYNDLDVGNVLAYNVTGLSSETTYYYRVRAFKNSSETDNSNIITVSTIASEPTTSGTVSFASVGSNSLTINFTGGNGTNRIVVLKSSNAVSFIPSDGSVYTGVNSDFSLATDQETGNKIVYEGTGNTVDITGLNSFTSYHVAVYELNGSGSAINYLTSSVATNNTTTGGPEVGMCLSSGAQIPSLNMNNYTTLTFTGWVKPANGASGTRRIIFENDNGGYDRVLCTYNGQWTIFHNNWYDSNVSHSVGSWQHVAVVFSPSYCKLYIDGVLRYTGPGATSTSGYTYTSLGANYSGYVDHMTFWSKELNAAEIKNSMFNYYVGNETDLQAYYTFNGSSFTDNSVNGRNGTGGCGFSNSYALVRPTIIDASNIAMSGFTANWTAPSVGEAPTNYYFDLDDNSDFSSRIISNSDLGNVLSFDITGLNAGTTYYYRLSAFNASTGFGPFSETGTITTLAQLTCSASVSNPLCSDGKGQITITANGGSSSYTYSIDGVNYQTSNVFNDLEDGSYTLTVKDSNDDTETTSADVSIPDAIVLNTVVTSPLCHNGTGSILVLATGGTGTLLYSNDGINFQTNNTFINLNSGLYTLTVKDANECFGTTSASLVNPTELVASISGDNVLCNGGTTTVTVSAIGGTAAYTNTGDYTVSAGTHEYTVTDANGCTDVVSISISEPTELVASISGDNVLCNGGTTTVTVSAIGGTAAYTNTGDYTVSAGTHEYTVTDANGCTDVVSISISEPTELVASINGDNVLCNGGTTSVVVSATGGTAAYTNTGDYTVSAGTHEYTVTDANGCTDVVNISISEPTELVASISGDNVLCNGGTTIVTVSATGGTAAYTNTGDYTVSAGTHEYTVTDANGCTDVVSISISEPTELVASISGDNVLCNGGTTTVTVSATGGTAAYTNTGDYTVSAGTHEYTVTDASGCTDIVSIIISEPNLLQIIPAVTNVSCYGLSDGSISLTALGGTLPYTFSPSQDIADLSAGQYSGSVNDANGCNTTISVEVTEPVLLTANAGENITINEGESIQLGEAPIQGNTYSWSPTYGLSNPNIANPIAQPGITTNYSLTVMNGPCEATDEVIVTVYTTYDLSGIVSYDNTEETAMNNCLVTLYLGGSPYANTITDALGYYEFLNLLPNTYTLSFSTGKDWGGVNSTDALAVQNHYAGNALLIQPRLTVADVNLSNTVNATDALLMKRRYSNLISSFVSGDWYFQTASILVDGDITFDVKALCYGDVNGSYEPSAAKQVANTNLNVNGTINATTGSIIEIPVQINNSYELGAVSLIINYPTDVINVTGVTSTLLNGMLTNIVDGKVYIAWSNSQGVNTTQGSAIITLQATVVSSQTAIAQLSLSDSEFADRYAQVISNVELDAPIINADGVTGVGNNEQSVISIYPNPTNGIVNISNASGASIEVYNAIGEKLINNIASSTITIVDLSVYPAGNYLIRIVKDGKSRVAKISVK